MKVLTVILITLLILPKVISAQEIWTGSTLRFKITKRIKSELEGQYRFQYADIKKDYSYLQGSLRYMFNPNYGIKGSYRQTLDYVEKKRYSFDVFYSPENDSLKLWFSTRLRLQESVNQSESLTEGKPKLRWNVNLTFNVSKKALPYFGSEIYYEADKGGNFKTLRIYMGLMTKISSRITLNTFYKSDYFLDAFNHEYLHYLGMMLVYKVKFSNKEMKRLDEETENN